MTSFAELLVDEGVDQGGQNTYISTRLCRNLPSTEILFVWSFRIFSELDN